jgi:uncharacterized protein (DUF433 family)
MAKVRSTTEPECLIDKRARVRGGAPVIAGTGIKVLDVAVRYEVMGMTPEEIMVALPHLDLPQIHAALSYYPPSQKATGVNPWMNVRWVPSVALAKEGTLRRVPLYEVSREVPRP